MESVIVANRIKKMALELGKSRYKNYPELQPTMVAQSFITACEDYLLAFIRERVANNRGKMIK